MIKSDSKESKYFLISSGELQSLSRLRPWNSMSVLFIEWLIIGTAIALYLIFPNPAVYLIVWLIIGSRMYALYSLLHDGIHYLLFPKRKVNDWLSRFFLALPLFTNFRTMRKHHLAHHQHLQTPEDPEQAHLNYMEFQFPQSISDLTVTFLKDVTGVNFLIYNLRKMLNLFLQGSGGKQTSSLDVKQMPDRYLLYRVFYYAAIFTIAFYMGWTLHLLLFWIVPYITLYQALNRLRLSTEHFHLARDKAYQTRTVKLNFLESFLLSPHNLGYHTEHHLYPSVPFYKLPNLHQQLMSKEEYQKNVIVNSSYLEVIKQYAK